MNCLLGGFEEEKGIADPRARMPEAVKKRGIDTRLQNQIMFTSILEEYVTAGRTLNSGLFSENEFVDDEQQKFFAEGQEGEAKTPMVTATTPMMVVDATWGMTPVEVVNMLIAWETTRAAILAVTEIGSSSRGKDDFQLKDKLDMEIEYIRRLMVRVSLK